MIGWGIIVLCLALAVQPAEAQSPSCYVAYGPWTNAHYGSTNVIVRPGSTVSCPAEYTIDTGYAGVDNRFASGGFGWYGNGFYCTGNEAATGFTPWHWELTNGFSGNSYTYRYSLIASYNGYCYRTYAQCCTTCSAEDWIADAPPKQAGVPQPGRCCSAGVTFNNPGVGKTCCDLGTELPSGDLNPTTNLACIDGTLSPCTDADGDGFYIEDYCPDEPDCDDTNAAVNANATEIACDFIDNDCSGFDDTTDHDEDGYYVQNTPLCDQVQIDNGLSAGPDCNDAVATTYPTAVEHCDQVDNDCNGAVDDRCKIVTGWEVPPGVSPGVTTETEYEGRQHILLITDNDPNQAFGFENDQSNPAIAQNTGTYTAQADVFCSSGSISMAVQGGAIATTQTGVWETIQLQQSFSAGEAVAITFQSTDAADDVACAVDKVQFFEGALLFDSLADQGVSFTENACCPANYCWSGVQCVSGLQEFSSTTWNTNKESFGTILDDWDNYTEVDAVIGCYNDNGVAGWTDAHKKYDPTFQSFGYCPETSQCFNGQVCFDSGEYEQDRYCEDGAWTSRTRKLAQDLLDIAGNQDHTLYCDTFINTLNRFNYNVPDVTGAPTIVRDLIDNGATNNFCVLEYDNRVIVGTTVNENVTESGIMQIFGGSECGFSAADNYVECSGDNFVWYNWQKNHLVYSSSYNPPSVSTATRVRDIFLHPIYTLSQLVFTEGASFTQRVINAPFANKTKDYNKLYLSQNTDLTQQRSIVGVLEEINPQERFLTVVYYNFNADICSQDSVACNVTPEGVYQVLDTENIPIWRQNWHELAGELRVK